MMPEKRTPADVDLSGSEPVSEGTCDGGAGGVVKIRSCLRCDERFESNWSGERICHRCKISPTWRNGEPYRRKRASSAKRNLPKIEP
jgi:hypothetical protein